MCKLTDEEYEALLAELEALRAWQPLAPVAERLYTFLGSHMPVDAEFSKIAYDFLQVMKQIHRDTGQSEAPHE